METIQTRLAGYTRTPIVAKESESKQLLNKMRNVGKCLRSKAELEMA